MKTCSLPRHLDFNAHLEKFPLSDYRLCKFNLDHARYLLGLISYLPLRDTRIDEELQDPEKKGFVPLSSILMKEVVHNYSDYMTYFEKTGVILINHSYKTQKKGDGYCKGYQFTEFYKSQEFLTVAFEKPVISDSNNKHKKIARNNYPLIITGLFKGLVIDGKRVREFARKKREALKKDPSLKELDKKKPGKIKDPDEQYKRLDYCVSLLENKEHFFSVDSVGKRLHWNLTNMPSVCRNFLSYEGEEGNERLVCIDIRNSQPYFLSRLLDEAFYDLPSDQVEEQVMNHHLTKANAKALKVHMDPVLRILKENNSDIDLFKTLVSDPISTLSSYSLSISSNTSNRYIYSFFYNRVIYSFSLFTLFNSYEVSGPGAPPLCCDKSQKTVSNKSDKQLFSTKVENSKNVSSKVSNIDIYEFMLEMSKKENLGYENRQQMKENMMVILFSKNGHREEEKRLFKTSFPTVYRVITEIKKKEHQLLARLLQNIESCAVLGKVIMILKQEFPLMPIYPIHDSISVPESYKEQVLAIMKEELMRLTGLPPMLKVEYWDPKNLEALEQIYDQVINKGNA